MGRPSLRRTRAASATQQMRAHGLRRGAVQSSTSLLQPAPDRIGYRPGRRLAFLAGLAELTGGLLLTLGLLTPLAAAIIIGTMIAAAAVHMRNGLWVQNGGYETPLLTRSRRWEWRSPAPAACRSTCCSR
ncbi:DoxX family membrane protein [Streptomyces mirabilis]|uniref:DoxX family membrane protein n=1 Tax=Streptomyces mirabilis TaxID=68239 RepID=UPI0036B4D9D9